MLNGWRCRRSGGYSLRYCDISFMIQQCCIKTHLPATDHCITYCIRRTVHHYENSYKLIRKEDAHLLAMYVQYFHTEEKGMKLLQCFNSTPEKFKYEDVIKAVETIGQ